MTRRRPNDRLWRALRLAGAALVVVTVGAGVAQAQTQHGASTSSGASPAKKTPASGTYSVPSQATSGPGIEQSHVAAAAQVRGLGENLAAKTLTRIFLPPLTVYAYPVQSTFIDPIYHDPNFSITRAEAWIIDNPATERFHPPATISYGHIYEAGKTSGPSVHVDTLGFGSIPISADLTLAQTVTNGLVDPIVVDDLTYPGPPFRTDGQYQTDFTASGRLTVQVSNLVVDGVSLHLASTCRTVSPALLEGYNTSVYQVFQGGYLYGRVTIPRFTGCLGTTVAGQVENLDPLLNGTIAGSTNPTVISQDPLNTFNPNFPDDCDPSPPAYQFDGKYSNNNCAPNLPLPTYGPSNVATTPPSPGYLFQPPFYGGGPGVTALPQASPTSR